MAEKKKEAPKHGKEHKEGFILGFKHGHAHAMAQLAKKPKKEKK